MILLPSKVTEAFAETVQKSIQGVEVAVRPLPEEENDADRAYAHFDPILRSAAGNAGNGHRGRLHARHEIPHVRYITGPRDENWDVIPGCEKIRETQTTVVACHRRLDLARDLMRRGSFFAAGTVLQDMKHPSSALYPDELIEIATAVLTATRFYSAWDRLDDSAASKVDVGGSPDDGWKELWPRSPAKE